MERELTLATVSLAACGSALLVGGALASASSARSEDAAELERACAGRVLRPLALAALVFAALLGWGLQEPDMTDEALSPWMLAPALLVALVWARALVRAALSLVSAARESAGPARTVGLLRPRVVVSPALRASLDASELRAVLAHEQAHARHRDPLRIWAGQLVTDLQWPLPAARARFAAWRRSLELARDDEARVAGVDGADLASAILKTARRSAAHPAAAAALVDDSALAARIARLLHPLPERPSRRTFPRAAILLAAACAAALVVGDAFGERIVQALAAVQR